MNALSHFSSDAIPQFTIIPIVMTIKTQGQGPGRQPYSPGPLSSFHTLCFQSGWEPGPGGNLEWLMLKCQCHRLIKGELCAASNAVTSQRMGSGFCVISPLLFSLPMPGHQKTHIQAPPSWRRAQGVQHPPGRCPARVSPRSPLWALVIHLSLNTQCC